jgi:hypothetical protein
VSYDESDAARDDFIDKLREELYPEHRDQAITEFTKECLQRYYLSKRDVLSGPMCLLKQSHSLAKVDHHAAALVFAFASIEMLLKSALMTPIVAGLIHNQSLAEPLADFLLGRLTALSRLKRLAFPIVLQHANIDLRTLKRAGSRQTLWEEIVTIESARNAIIHTADLSEERLFATAMSLAEFTLDNLFTAVLYYVGLHLHGNEICDVTSIVICSDKARPSLPLKALLPSPTLVELRHYLSAYEPQFAYVLFLPAREIKYRLEDDKLIISYINPLVGKEGVRTMLEKRASELYQRPITVEFRD